MPAGMARAEARGCEPWLCKPHRRGGWSRQRGRPGLGCLVPTPGLGPGWLPCPTCLFPPPPVLAVVPLSPCSREFPVHIFPSHDPSTPSFPAPAPPTCSHSSKCHLDVSIQWVTQGLMRVCVLPKRGGKVLNSCPGSAPRPLEGHQQAPSQFCSLLCRMTVAASNSTAFSRGLNEVVQIKQQITPPPKVGRLGHPRSRMSLLVSASLLRAGPCVWCPARGKAEDGGAWRLLPEQMGSLCAHTNVSSNKITSNLNH